jgi:endonuclease/exonuclease/phosphatase family metal-dependent hydrolase
MRYALFCLMIAAVPAGCGREAAELGGGAPFGCTAATVIQRFSPPTVTFISDSAPALRPWRTNVGPPVVDRAVRSCEQGPIDSLLVVSWNVHLGHAEIIRFVNDLRAGRALPGIGVRHFVILMQEAFRESDEVPARTGSHACPRRMGGGGADIEALADSLGLALFYVPSMRNGCDGGPRQDRGNAILSTLPLTNLKAVELPLMRQRRVAALADVKGEATNGQEWTLSLASVHFENRGPGVPRSWVHGRARQARALVAALSGTPLAAVGGDFNTLNGMEEPAVKIVGSHFSHTPEHQRNVTFVSYAVMRSQLDYLFFRCAGHHRSKYWRALERYGSDHYPIMGFVRVAAPPTD